MEQSKRWVWYLVGAVVLSCALMLFLQKPAHAADLNSEGCCSDLEDRIAELETVAAHKGNRKITLTIDGQINEAYTYVSIGDFRDGKITENGNDRSYVGFTGVARVNPDISVGYRLEIDIAQLGLLNAPIGDNTDTGVRQSYWFIKSDTFGKVSVGQQGIASNDLDKWSTNRAWIAGKPLSLGSLSDLYLTGADLPFDGDYRSAIRYDSPTLNGFSLSASWSDSVKDWSGGNGNSYDVAGDIGLGNDIDTVTAGAVVRF